MLCRLEHDIVGKQAKFTTTRLLWQTKVSTLSPQVAYLDHQRLVLNVDNSALKQRIAALAQDKLFKDAHCESLKNELQRLRNVYHHQQQCLETEVQRLMVEFDTEHQQMQQGFDINSSLINGMDGNGHQVHSENGEGINISNCSGSNQQFLLPMSCLKDETSTKAYPSDYMVHNS